MERLHNSRRRSFTVPRPPLSVVLALVALTFASAALAQTPVTPNPDPAPRTPEEASLPRQEEPGRWSPWTIGLTANQGYEGGNAGTLEGLSDTRISTGLQAQISRSWLLRRGAIAFSASGGQTRYQEGQNQLMYGFGLATSHQFTRRFSQYFAASASRSFAEDSSLLVNAGVVLPRIVTENQVFSTGLSYQLSRKNSIEGSVAGARVTFPTAAELTASPGAPLPVPSAAHLTSNSSYTLRGAFSRQLHRDHTLGVSFGNTISTGGSSGDVQGLLANYTALLGRRFTLSASGGIKPYRVTGDAKRRYAPGALIGISVGTFNNQTLWASYERTVEQAYGLAGTHLCHRFNSNYSLGFGKMVIDGNVNYGLNTYPEVADFTQIGWTTGVSASYTIIRNLSIGANYSLALNEQTGSASVRNSRGGVSVGYGFSWR